jgi:ribonucleotide monophosphatase NagD (HAD superfamily)
MIGDSIKSDIKGGNTNGFDTFLVKTGLYTKE